jgi:hypothetical protein
MRVFILYHLFLHEYSNDRVYYCHFLCPRNNFALMLNLFLVIEPLYKHYRCRDSDWLWAVRPRGRSSGPGGAKTFFFIATEPALVSIQRLFQWVPTVLSPRREPDHSPLFSAEVKNYGSASQLLHTPSWRGAWLIEHRGNFTCF